MARKVTRDTSAPPAPVETRTARPLVFLSHDSRDADLAEAFDNLLADASGGVLKTFRSSDRKGFAGIEFGAEWYSTIMAKLTEATDVVALLTPHSLERPWILYEVGVARGTLRIPALGVVFGVPLDRIRGPFAQFQNSGDDEDSLTKLVIQLIQRNPDASPRTEAVRRQVIAFRQALPTLIKAVSDSSPTEPASDGNAIAKLFEEVKVMFSELSALMRDQSSRSQATDFAFDARKIRHLYGDLLSGVEVGLRRIAVHNVRTLYPDLDKAVADRIISPAAAHKRLATLTFGEVRDILRALVRSGQAATKLPRLEDLDQLNAVIHVRNKLTHGERVGLEELAQALADLMNFINENAELIFDSSGSSG